MTEATMQRRYALPSIPVTPIDLINRRAAATGSVRYAQMTEHGDYNGHYTTVSFKAHAVSGPTWNAEYYWGQRVVLGRGSFKHCIDAAVSEHKRGARGTVVAAYLDELAPESLEEQKAILEAAGFKPEEFVEGGEPKDWSPKHFNVIDALHWADFGFGGLVQVALAFEGTREEWKAHRDAWLKENRR